MATSELQSFSGSTNFLGEFGARTMKNAEYKTVKHTFSSTMKAALPLTITTAPEWRNPLRKDLEGLATTLAASRAEKSSSAEKETVESTRELIAKKREIFLVQMGLDTKVQEIAKLKDRAVQRDAALSKAERMLEDDTKRFDNFLKDNAAKLQEAMAFADTQTRAKQEKIMEIKRLNDALANTRSELIRTEERLEDAKKLQKFLHDLTPQEWREGLVQARDERHAEKMVAWQRECDSLSSRIQEAEQTKDAGAAAYEAARTQQEADKAQAAIKEASAALHAAQSQDKPEEPLLEPIDRDAAYFKEPKQLLDIFARLEVQNLVVIQGMQEATAALEQAKNKYEAQKARLDAELADLQRQVLLLEQAKAQQEQLCQRLQGSIATPSGAGSLEGEAETTQAKLNEWVSAAFQQCGFANDGSQGIVTMMTMIEGKLDACLAIGKTMPVGFVEDWEKAQEKERRQVAREEKKRVEAEEYKSRLARANERAASPTFKRSGKPPMTRSVLRQKVAVEEEADAAKQAEAELQRYIDRPFPL